MSGEQPHLIRKLLDPEAPADGAVEAGPVATTQHDGIQVAPDDAELVQRRFTRVASSTPAEPPDGFRRFGPAWWPWPAGTPVARIANIAVVALAVGGAFAGLFFTWYHVTTDPLADVRAYFDAAVRLNHGQPLYPTSLDPNAAVAYPFPPLLAVALRPMALLGWPAFAAIWEAIVVGSFVLLLRHLGAGMRTWLAVGILAIPAGWCLAIGQAQVPLTLLLAIGQPWSIALGANLNLFTALAALWWIGRRDWEATGAFVAWVILFGLLQAVLELSGSTAFVQTLGANAGRLLDRSPFAFAPLTWPLLVGLGIFAALVWAHSRWGWLAAVVLTSLAALPFLPWRLIGLLAAVREPEIAGVEPAVRPYQPIQYGRR